MDRILRVDSYFYPAEYLYPELTTAVEDSSPDLFIEIRRKPELRLPKKGIQWYPILGGRIGITEDGLWMETRELFGKLIPLDSQKTFLELGPGFHVNMLSINMLETALMLSLRSIGYAPLHASGGILKKNILFAGRSGSGKSTMAYNLLQMGGKILSDDRIFLKNHEGGTTAYSLTSHISLKEGDDPENRIFTRLHPEEAHPGSTVDHMRPEIIVFSQIKEIDEHKLESISKSEAAMNLLPLTLPPGGIQDIRPVISLSRQCECYKLSIAEGNHDLDEIIYKIVED